MTVSAWADVLAAYLSQGRQDMPWLIADMGARVREQPFSVVPCRELRHPPAAVKIV